MQASTFSVRGGVGFEISNRSGRVLSGFGDIRSRRISVAKIARESRCNSLRFGSLGMGAELTRAVSSVGSVFGKSVKARSVRAQASGLST